MSAIGTPQTRCSRFRGSGHWSLADPLAMARTEAIVDRLAPLEVDSTRPGFRRIVTQFVDATETDVQQRRLPLPEGPSSNSECPLTRRDLGAS